MLQSSPVCVSLKSIKMLQIKLKVSASVWQAIVVIISRLRILLLICMRNWQLRILLLCRNYFLISSLIRWICVRPKSEVRGVQGHCILITCDGAGREQPRANISKQSETNLLWPVDPLSTTWPTMAHLYVARMRMATSSLRLPRISSSCSGWMLDARCWCWCWHRRCQLRVAYSQIDMQTAGWHWKAWKRPGTWWQGQAPRHLNIVVDAEISILISALPSLWTVQSQLVNSPGFGNMRKRL